MHPTAVYVCTWVYHLCMCKRVEAQGHVGVHVSVHSNPMDLFNLRHLLNLIFYLTAV